jgi:hypothetical protein
MSVKRDTVEARKAMPLASGFLDYFPDAMLVVAEVSRIGNEQHHPGEPLHWDKSKSTDEADALLRHLLDRGTIDTDGVRHTAKVAWRAMALLQRELDAEAAAEEEKASAPLDLEVALTTLRGWPLECDWYHTGVHDPWCRVNDSLAAVKAELTAIFDPLLVEVENRGEWPPDTRVAGRLTCCGASEHTLDCAQYR